MRNRLMLLLVAIMIAGAAPAQAENATFKLTNSARFRVMVKVFSQSRDWQWPSKTRQWVLDDSAQHSLKIACNRGEPVCFGGSFADDKTHWGVGLTGKMSCKDCCLTCGTNVSHAWNLTDGTPRTATNRGGIIDNGPELVPVNE